jgi:hypothetical protein
MQHISPHGWQPPPSPYENQQAPRGQPVYRLDPSYSGVSSISAPNWCSSDGQFLHPQAVNGNIHDGRYHHSQAGQEWLARPGYGLPENQQNRIYPQSLPPVHYGNPYSTGPHPSSVHPPDYVQHYTEPYGAGERRKPVRAVQACDSCRKRKAKCDEARPVCQHCRDNELKCFYEDETRPKREQPRIRRIDSLDRKVDKILQILENHHEPLSERSIDKRASQLALQDDTGDESVHVKDESTYGFHSTPRHTSPSGSTFYHKKKNDSDTTDEFALPVNHTTAAQNLFSWPSVGILMPKDRPEDYADSYVMDLESKRGLLRLYDSGEGEDENYDEAGTPSPANSFDEAQNDSELSSALPSQSPTKNLGGDSTGRDHLGGVSPHDTLILNRDLVDIYVRSYLANIHILQPFLEIKTLQDIIARFKSRYDRGSFSSQCGGLRTRKRKRLTEDSLGSSSDENSLNKLYHSSSIEIAEIEHSITNAIILLVLALGNICLHKAPLLGPIASRANHPRGKDIDVIPGLAYYAVAANILGESAGGGEISHIQANLLAGLYMGQLARIIQSHFYISNACKSCQILIESTEYKFDTTPARRNLINFAFWTCLQLESDILAEIPLPPSGITRYQAKMIAEMPNGVTSEPNSDEIGLNSFIGTPHIFQILRFYSTQIQLRRTLNDVHFYLYKDKESYDQKPLLKVIESLNINLEAWRSSLKDWNWNDREHKSADINVARMRAKYYGAKYIIHRPALRYLLTLRTGVTPTSDSRLSESPDGFAGRGQIEIAPPYQTSFEAEVQVAAEACVAAAVKSTTVFDCVPERIIITNIFGTAHA